MEFKLFLRRILKKDRELLNRISRHFPRIVSVVDLVLEWSFEKFTHPAFALIATCLLVVLAATNVIDKIIAAAIAVAWLVTVIWIARSKPLRELTVLSRWVSVLAVGVFFGFLGDELGSWALREYQRQKAVEQSTSQPNVSFAQEQIKELNKFIIEPDEMTLREEFGLNEMMSMNIKLVKDMVANSKGMGPRSLGLLQYAQNKEIMVVNDLTVGHLSRHGGAFQLEGDASTVFEVVLPSAYSSNIRRLGKFEVSSELPSSIIQTLNEFDAAVKGNAETLARVEDAALKRNPNYFLYYDDFESPFFHQIDTLYFDKFIQLRPKADRVRDAIRQFGGVK